MKTGIVLMVVAVGVSLVGCSKEDVLDKAPTASSAGASQAPPPQFKGKTSGLTNTPSSASGTQATAQ